MGFNCGFSASCLIGQGTLQNPVSEFPDACLDSVIVHDDTVQ